MNNQVKNKNIEQVSTPQLSNKPFIFGVCSVVLFVFSCYSLIFIGNHISNFTVLFSLIFLLVGFSSLRKFKKVNKEYLKDSNFRKSNVVLIISSLLISATAIYFIVKMIYLIMYGFGRY